MASRRTESGRVLGFFGELLGRREWVYSLSLLVPFAVYNLALKVSDIASRPRRDRGLYQDLKLVRSDVFFNAGYASLWVGLFAAARRGALCRVVVVLFHAATALVAAFRTCAHQYFKETGTTLDYDIVALWIPRFDEVKPMIKLPRLAWILLAAALFYVILGPLLATRAIERVARRRGWPKSPPDGTRRGFSLLVPLGLCLQALGLGSLSLLADPAGGAGKSFARDPFVNLILTGVKGAFAGEHAPDVVPARHPAGNARLARTSRTEERNVVLVHLESTRARSVTPYNKNLKTTPFLDELAKRSLLVERAYTTMPHTSKAVVSVNCGIPPGLRPNTEMESGGIPVRGLAGLLAEQGYHTVFFQSSTENFDNLGDLAKSFGYEEYYPLESIDDRHREGFERSNYFGYEDDIMLKPSEEWLKGRGDGPFVAKYLTGTGHHEYLPPARYGREDFSEDDRLNRYLNCLRYQDFFVRNLIEQYKELGLYDDTIFVVYGDHGEAFGEHGRYAHDDVPYEESLRVPLIIHDPKRFQEGERVGGLANHTDILPTVLDMLGFEVEDGEYPGCSLLHPLPEDRTLMFSCFNKDKCLASIRGSEKYIHHYGDRPDELFDLEEDPLEERNLAGERPIEAGERRDELLAWRSRIDALYGGRRYGRKKRL